MVIGHSMTDSEKIREIIKRRKFKVYFIGIGGISMSALAEISQKRGAVVFGSDIRKSGITERLTLMGIGIKYTQLRANIMEASPDIAVYSLSISSDNPEYRAARELGITVASRAEYLGVLMEDYGTRLGVSGSHGKSTTTAMLASALSVDGKAPTVLCGAELSRATGYVHGGEDFLVYEACEYCDSFLKLRPSVQVVLNIDLDHTDYFSGTEQLCESFFKAASSAEKFAVLNADCPNIKSILPGLGGKAVTYSSLPGADFGYEIKKASRGFCGIRLFGDGKEYSFSLGVPGRFNAENAVAAAVAALKLGVSEAAVSDALSGFHGIPRRLELISKKRGADIYYDYAHHPKEIEALSAAFTAIGYKNICAVFAPHTYSRTKSFLDEFARALAGFAAAYVTDIYGAREGAIVGVSSAALAESVRAAGGKAYALANEESLDKILSEGYDCIVLMGAGDLDKIKKKIEDM